MQATATGATARRIVDIAVCISPLSPAAVVARPGWAMSERIARKVAAPDCGDRPAP